MPWTLLSIALATTGTPVLAECDGDPSLQTLLADPANAEIEVEAGCDHSLVSSDISWTVAVRGQVPVYPQTRPRLRFPDGVTNDELFRVSDGADVTVEGVDLLGKDTLGTYGGRALNSSGGTVLLRDVEISEFVQNVAGAVIYIDDGVLAVEDADIHDNQALYGGVIWVHSDATATFTSTTATANLATGTGGFAYVEAGGTLQLFDVTATDHTGPYGGFVGARGTVVVDGLVSSDHHATTSTGGAFHIENSNASLSLCNADLSDGSAGTLGGAIYARGAITVGTACALSSGPGPVQFARHSASEGGAIEAFGASAPVVVSDATFLDHSATVDGGTLHLQSNDATLTNVLIDGSEAERGGAIRVQSPASFALTDSVVQGGTATVDGGCIHLQASSDGTSRLTDVSLTDCTASENGGALWSDGALDVEGLAISNALAVHDGGGMYLVTDDDRSFSDLQVVDTFAGGDGGAIAVHSATNDTTALTDVVVERCDAVEGSALAVVDAAVTVYRFRFEDGMASAGGAVFLRGNNADLTLRQGLICDSTSGTGGVSATATDPELFVDQVGFVGNSAVRGGAIDIQDTSDATLTHLHFVGNIATLGAALAVGPGASVTLSDAVVSDNHATAATSGAIDGIVATSVWYEANSPVDTPDDPLTVETPSGMLHDGSCTWAALRTVDRAEQGGVWGPVAYGVPTTWPDDDDPFRDADGDSVPWLHDCDDDDGGRSYLAPELCDDIDNDCDGRIDDEDDDVDLGSTTRFYRDTDLDGRGDESDVIDACTAPDGYVATAGDCDDTNPSLPLAVYRDLDGDGIGSGPPVEDLCTSPAPAGQSFQDDDCDDGDATVRGPVRVFLDEDFDGYGSDVELGEQCPDVPGVSPTNDDCDDTRSDIFPGAQEVCDEVDQDCDNDVDEGVQLEVWVDNDGDGVGVGEPTLTCDPEAGALLGGDCNDTDPGRAFDCDEETATNTGDDDDDDTTTPTPAEEPRVASSGCACDATPPLASFPWLARRR